MSSDTLHDGATCAFTTFTDAKFRVTVRRRAAHASHAHFVTGPLVRTAFAILSQESPSHAHSSPNTAVEAMRFAGGAQKLVAVHVARRSLHLRRRLLLRAAFRWSWSLCSTCQDRCVASSWRCRQ